MSVIVISSKPSIIHESSSEGKEVISLSGGTKNLPSCIAEVLAANIRRRYDAVHVFTGCSTVLGIVTLVLGRLKRVPAALSLFGREDFVHVSRLNSRLFNLALGLATSIDVNTSYTKSLVPGRFQSKTFVLLGGAEQRPEGSLRTPLRSGQRILFVGRLARRKGIDDLIEAYVILHRELPESRLVVVGSGPDRERLESIASSAGVAEFVDFKGALLGDKLHEEYEASDVVVLPSKQDRTDTATEGLGLTLIEASMHGKPLVGTLHGGIPEIIKDGENGLLVPPGSPTALARALKKILAEPELKRRMGETALSMAKTRFNWATATDVLLGTYV